MVLIWLLLLWLVNKRKRGWVKQLNDCDEMGDVKFCDFSTGIMKLSKKWKKVCVNNYMSRFILDYIYGMGYNVTMCFLSSEIRNDIFIVRRSKIKEWKTSVMRLRTNYTKLGQASWDILPSCGSFGLIR